jgi:hypothetical protein
LPRRTRDPARANNPLNLLDFEDVCDVLRIVRSTVDKEKLLDGGTKKRFDEFQPFRESGLPSIRTAGVS